MLPSLPTPLPHFPPPVHLPSPSPPPLDPDPPSTPSLSNTEPNSFGLFRQYTKFPGSDPEDARTIEDCYQSPGLAVHNSPSQPIGPSGSGHDKAGIFPALNKTVKMLLQWYYSGSTTKSLADLGKLVKDVLLSPDYSQGDLRDFSATRVVRELDEAAEVHGRDERAAFPSSNGWKSGSVKLRVPVAGQKYKSEEDAPLFEVTRVHYRSLIAIIKSAFEDPIAESFHYFPFKLFWKKPVGGTPERVITELYNSDAFIEEHTKLQQKPREPGCNLEVAVAALMFWSDSTHMANFGTASLWPIYCYLGNQSKYSRAKPTSFAAHHLAYMPTLPDSFQDWYRAASGGVSASPSLVTHLKRELIHAIWLLLLDEEFCYAYVHGVIVMCGGGVRRRLFPRLFTYSADYPEKVLLATIRFLGGCPCPRCKIKKQQISGLGSPDDSSRRKEARIDNLVRQKLVNKARKVIFGGKGPGSTAVEKILQPLSMVPTRNAFSTRLSQHGFDFHKMFVPDLLHEFELGTWKATFTHLVRILRANGDGPIQELNRSRYRQVPTFGDGTIRLFSEDASGMKKLAARDFEDLLQCAIPVFESLLPAPHDATILDLLFIHAKWHALAKLRLHTETTLKLLDDATVELGEHLRKFRDGTCSHYYTEELPRQEATRGHQKAKLVGASSLPGKDRGFRSFNLSTYKLHALGDYAASIWLFGTSDGFSTQIGELEHRRVKKFYVRTNKRSGFVLQITKHERREQLLRQMEEADRASQPRPKQKGNTIHLPFAASEPLAPTQPNAHYDMSRSRSFPINVTSWLGQNTGDPADFLPKLKKHLLERLEGVTPGTREFSTAELNALQFSANRVYQHKYLRINYTSYDLQRSQDSINPRSHPDILILADNTSQPDNLSDNSFSSSHPYLYARTLGIFHADIRWHKARGSLREVQTKQMDFLWVRWFILAANYPFGLGRKRLPRLEFASESQFGFVDPNDVLRGCHLIPAFASGFSNQLGPSIIYLDSDEPRDWRYHCANIFVDRDMFMRYQGGGIGHGALAPPTDAASFVSQDQLEREAWEDLAESTSTTEEELGADGFGGPDPMECDEYGYENGKEEYAASDEEFREDGMHEDGEGQWDSGAPEIDGYGSLN
ncbi:hypothetical protein AGABI2DRAFT_62391 [Agaricus bisporus var. bisporus H97]|uniref:hypothetical protein n=1 Tax=Agaricus bisporus var. bisporus (strain H97 / ATCC MYA-4626 / FGSC 10389) TaxID=936046 RepID=UPI00029F7A94|nr:hypothetical protein AGABI2DRAFT_62391 [Agaricus bisporus var. bisporus H97]EKV51232.1 hypothetical protein AGABI2DRAFT_62391 [Agaricus bisporus var. bisporus H97]